MHCCTGRGVERVVENRVILRRVSSRLLSACLAESSSGICFSTLAAASQAFLILQSILSSSNRTQLKGLSLPKASSRRRSSRNVIFAPRPKIKLPKLPQDPFAYFSTSSPIFSSSRCRNLVAQPSLASPNSRISTIPCPSPPANTRPFPTSHHERTKLRLTLPTPHPQQFKTCSQTSPSFRPSSSSQPSPSPTETRTTRPCLGWAETSRWRPWA